MNDQALLHELEPVAARLLDRHVGACKAWFPHEFVPWERGALVDFDADFVAPSDLDERLASALIVNLLTEDNLPYYLRDIERMFGRDGAWGEWVRRWTAEEGRHSIALRDYLTVSGMVDPKALEQDRMHQVMTGQVPEPPTAVRGLLYLTIQELATRIAHHNTAKLMQDPAGYEVMKRVAADENHHFLFYRDIASAAIEIDPSAAVIGLEAEVSAFEMPGTGIRDFARHSHNIAKLRIYDFGVHHDQILVPVVKRHWGIEKLTGLSDEAERARDNILAFISRIGDVARRLAERAAAEPASI